MTDHIDEPHNEGDARVTRSEWIAIGALAISLLQGAYMVGVQVQVTQEHQRRLDAVEAKATGTDSRINGLSESVARIDTNVTFLTELAKEQRQRSER